MIGERAFHSHLKCELITDLALLAAGVNVRAQQMRLVLMSRLVANNRLLRRVHWRFRTYSPTYPKLSAEALTMIDAVSIRHRVRHGKTTIYRDFWEQFC